MSSVITGDTTPNYIINYKYKKNANVTYKSEIKLEKTKQIHLK